MMVMLVSLSSCSSHCGVSVRESSFSLWNPSKGLGLGLPVGICWFDEDVVEVSFGVMMYLLPSVLSLVLV